MGSALAIVSKAVFEKLAKANGGAELGDVLGIDRYASTHASLDTLGDGGALFLVTVRPPDEQLWLVAVLERPERQDDGWYAAASTTPITDVSSAKSKLRFTSGTGITAKPGALGMSLQTPRALTAEDEALLRGGKGKPSAAKQSVAKPTPKAPAKKAAKAKTATAPKTARKPARDEDDGAAAPAAKPAKATPAKATPAKSSGAAAGGLDAVREALDDGDGAAALTAALAAWRATRSPGLADLIDAISDAISPPAIEDDGEWSKIAAGRDPALLGALLPAIPKLPVSFLPSAAEALAELGEDPRIAKAAQAWILDPPTQSSSAYPFWTRLYKQLAAIGDARLLPAIKKRLKLPQTARTGFGDRKAKPSQFWGKYYDALDKLAKQIAAVPQGADDKSLGKLGKLAAALDEVAIATPAPARRSTAPKVGGPPLAQALAHALADRVVDAIDALLVAWRANKAPELADAIDRATRLLPTYDQPLPVEPKAAIAAWDAAYAADPGLALPQLVQHLNTGGAAAAERHLLQLARLPDDPRIAIRIAELACRFEVGPQRTQYWKSMWELYAKTADPRGNAVLRAHFNDFESTYYDHYRQGRRIAGAFVLDATPATLSAADHQALAQVLAAIGTLEAKRDRTERDLIAAVVAEWSDDGPRLVYADWLTERGHQRGEAIVLACKANLSGAENKRLAELSGSWRNTVHTYGPFSDIGHTRERGFPVTVVPDHLSSALTFRRIAGDPLLATVEVIDLQDTDPEGRAGGLAAYLAPVMLDPTATRLARVAAPGNHWAALEPLVGTRWKLSGNDLVRR